MRTKVIAFVCLVVMAISTLSVGPAIAHSVDSGQQIYYSWSGWGSYCATVSASYDHPASPPGWNGIIWARQFGNPCPGYPPGNWSGPLMHAYALTYKIDPNTGVWTSCDVDSVPGTSQTVAAVNSGTSSGFCSDGRTGAVVNGWADTNFPGYTYSSSSIALGH